jgi:hypothetical protein
VGGIAGKCLLANAEYYHSSKFVKVTWNVLPNIVVCNDKAANSELHRIFAREQTTHRKRKDTLRPRDGTSDDPMGKS